MQCYHTDVGKIESDKEGSRANGSAYHVVLSCYRTTGTDIQVLRRHSCIVWEIQVEGKVEEYIEIIGGEEDRETTIRTEATRKRYGVPVVREHGCDGTGGGPDSGNQIYDNTVQGVCCRPRLGGVLHQCPSQE